MIRAHVHDDAEAARRCLLGELVAEQLTTTARELVVAWLHVQGMTDAQIAARTRLSTYTTFRIRSRLGLSARRSPYLARSSVRGS